MKVPQMSPWLGRQEAANVLASIQENWITEGPRSAQFVQHLCDLTGATHAVLAPNGTLALYLGLVAAGITSGDEVIVPDTTFIASANAVIMAGARPVFVDVNPDNFQIDLSHADTLITPKTRAVMPVHLYGMAVNMKHVKDFSDRHGLMVIEDAAQGIGVTYKGQHVGTFGDVGCFSFFADKTITTGEGGMVVTRCQAVYEKLLLLRNQGRINRGSFVHPAVGYNFRMTDLQAGVGLAQLDRLDEIIDRKRTILGWYQQELKSLDHVHFTKLEPGSTHVPFRAVLICEEAHKLMAFLESREIQPRTSFYPLHRQPCFAPLSRDQGGSLDLSDERYPNAVFGYEHGVMLPCFPTMTRQQVSYVCRTIRRFYMSSHGIAISSILRPAVRG